MDQHDQEKLKEYMLEEGISSIDYLIRMNKALLRFAQTQRDAMKWITETGFLD